jgi:hypothetical protein
VEQLLIADFSMEKQKRELAAILLFWERPFADPAAKNILLSIPFSLLERKLSLGD